MPELDKKAQEQEGKATPPVLQERKSGALYLVVFLLGIFMIVVGLGVFEPIFGSAFKSQLQSIYSTAMALCLSCIGLGKIKFGTLLDLSIFLALFLALYKLLEVRNVAKK
jgi:hypothetical protein